MPIIDTNYFIGGWKVDLPKHQISRNRLVQDLEPKAIAVLRELIEAKGKTVTRKQLQERVWQKTIVSDAALNRVIAQLRKSFSDSATKPQIIATIPKVGYRIVCPIKRTAPKAEEILSPSNWQSPWFLVASLPILLLFFYLMWGDFPIVGVSNQEKNDLTDIAGSEIEPSLSPDGHYLSFSHTTQPFSRSSIYVKDLTSQRYLRLTNGQHADRSAFWDHQGRSLIFLRNENSSCEVRQHFINWDNFSKGKEVVLFKCNQNQQLSSVTLFGDTNDLLFSLKSQKNQPFNTFRYDLESRELESIIAAPQQSRGNLESSISPNGTMLAVFQDNWQKYVFKIYQLADKKLLQTIETSSDGVYFKWFNNQSLIFSHSGGVSRVDIAIATTEEIFYSEKPLTSLEIKDEKNLLSSLETYGTDIGYFHLSGENAGATSNIAQHSNYLMYPRFNKDSTKLAFMDFGEETIYLGIKDLVEKTTKRVKAKRYIFMLGWSPDNSKILGTSDNQAWTMDVKTGDVHRLTSEDWKIISPVWSTDGKSIFFSSKQSGEWQIWQKELASETLKQMTFNGGHTVKVSLDGKYLYFNRQKEVGLWQLTLQSGALDRLFDYNRDSFWPDFYPTEKGIYFIALENSEKKVKYFDFSDRSVSEKMKFPGNWGSQFSINRDASIVAFEDFSTIESNIINIHLAGTPR